MAEWESMTLPTKRVRVRSLPESDFFFFFSSSSNNHVLTYCHNIVIILSRQYSDIVAKLPLSQNWHILDSLGLPITPLSASVIFYIILYGLNHLKTKIVFIKIKQSSALAESFVLSFVFIKYKQTSSMSMSFVFRWLEPICSYLFCCNNLSKLKTIHYPKCVSLFFGDVGPIFCNLASLGDNFQKLNIINFL